MALGKPFINTFKPFNASTEKVVPFIYNGENFTKRQYKITYQNGNWLNATEQDSTFVVANKEFSITLPQNTCINGNGFIIYIRVGNNNEWSEWSNGCYFWCYSDGVLSFDDNTLASGLTTPILYLANNSYEFKGQYVIQNDGDGWNTCQYILKQYDSINNTEKTISNSGVLCCGVNNNFPSFIFDSFTQTNGVVYKIVLLCTTHHGISLQCEQPFVVSSELPSVFTNTEIKNLKDENNNFVGKIQIDATVSRLKADNNDDINLYNFIQDTNNISNYFIDLTNDNREITFTQGCEFLEDDWNLLVHIKNFRNLEKESIISPITNLPISYKLIKNPFIKVYDNKKNNKSFFICYYDNSNKRFYIEYTNNFATTIYCSEEITQTLNTSSDNKWYIDLFSILIKKKNECFYISAYKN